MNLENILIWYQQRIGHYDKQSWETTVEQRILRGLSYSPRKTTKPKADLIDVDLVRGSTFPKAKPQSDVWLAGLHGIIRILLLPLYCRWWIRETTYIGFALVVSMYCSIMAACILYFTFSESKEFKMIPRAELLIPTTLLILLSIILSQMTCTRRKRIKVAFRGNRMGRGLRNGRKSRSSQRNSIVTPLVLAGLGNTCESTEDDSHHSHDLKERGSSLRISHSTLRSHSEDLHSSPTLDVGNRSASENNLSLSCEKIEGYSPMLSQVHLSSSMQSCSSDRPTSYRINQEQCMGPPPSNNCNLRYRGFGPMNKKLKVDARPNSRTRARFSGLPFARSWVERSSDGCSDGEEGCHTDCDSPSTDEDEIMQREKKPSIKKLPFVSASNDGSNSSCDSDGQKNVASHRWAFGKHKPFFTEWMTTASKSEDPSYSSESEAAWDELGDTDHREPIDWHIQGAPAAVISSTTKDVDKGEISPLTYLTSSHISCKIWEEAEMKKVDLSVLDISSAIISRVDSLHQSCNYLVFGLVMAGILSLVPSLYRLLLLREDTCVEGKDQNNTLADHNISLQYHITTLLLGHNCWCFLVIFLNSLNRLVLGACFFFLLSVAERTFKQRFLYAKHFCYLTSARRARKYDLPHFRLNKVINIKAWLSIRSCLKKRGPQHSVDVIISATFIVTLLLVFYLGVEALKDEEKGIQPLHNCELFVWCFAVSIYLIRFMTLGALINKKYSSPSVLITEQINMYLHMEQNPEKKDNLMLANNVLKLVSVLLKELDSPFKISGLSANTLLYNITKFGILSACSGVLSNLLGFKLKLHNIKFR